MVIGDDKEKIVMRVDFVFEPGKPWRKMVKGDSPAFDHSMMDDCVCPVHAIRQSDGAIGFVLDVQVDCMQMDPNDPKAPDTARYKALTVAMTLTTPCIMPR